MRALLHALAEKFSTSVTRGAGAGSVPPDMEKTARKIISRLQGAGHVAFYAGGCVRDSLLGREPQDYDVATDARPEDVQRLFARTVAVGAQFGVILVIDGEYEVEVASFRTDGLYIDGRRPAEVAFSTPERDAQRRDFTINGMFYDPIAERLIDYVGGQADLEARVVRAIGNARDRIREDRLRMLRAVRIAAALDFGIEEGTWEAIREEPRAITAVSAERIREELTRIFTSSSRVRGFDLLDGSGLMAAILPEVAALKGCEQPPQFHPEGDVHAHTRLMLGLLPESAPATLAFSVLFHDIGKPPTQFVDSDGRIRFNGHDKVGAAMTRDVMERLRFSRAEIEATVEAVDQHMIFKDVQSMRESRLRRFMSRPNFLEELELHRVDCASSHGMLDNFDFLRTKREEFANEPIIPPPLITGRDLIGLGWKPGPQFGEVLEAVQTRQLDGALTSSEEALQWVRAEFGGAV